MKQFQLPREFAQKWVNALRSGDYKQGTSSLMTESYDELKGVKSCEYCCLGVAASFELEKYQLIQQDFIPTACSDELPYNICGEEGLPPLLAQLNDGITQSSYEKYVDNEGHKFRPDVARRLERKVNKGAIITRLSFEEIADFIEDNVEFIN